MGCLGVDTSCYRTSVAYADGRGYVQQRVLLEVPPGKRGLMQSELLFQHVQNLPGLVEALCAGIGGGIDCVCASARPRPAPGSYMPVFTAGAGLARSAAALLGVPFFETTHQQCHLRAAMLDGRPQQAERFLALHLSGGTTELLRCGRELDVELLGGTSDLNAGQLVDRAGVALGCAFPAGPELEALALGAEPQSLIPASVDNLRCSFSGAEAQLMRMAQSGGYGKERIAAEVYSVLARTLAKLLENAAAETGISEALLFGGVASSALLRRMLQARLDKKRVKITLRWASPELSGDNAVGAALIGWERLKQKG